MITRLHYLASFFVLFALTSCGPDLPPDVAEAYAELPEVVDFNQHVRPFLSDRCWSCHGPDAGSRQAGLRLDTPEGAFATLESGHAAFVAGKPGSSEAIVRLLAEDPEIVMPTPESKLTVEPREIALLVKWLEQGAEWKDHWAWLPIASPAVPDNPAGLPAYNAIDNFVNAELARQGQTPNGRADNERLLRRVYLDLTGLPPTPAAMDAWLADPSDEAYSALVDELLASDAGAERLAMEWLDVARYADSHGMHADGARLSHPYRDWIIEAFRTNKPYDAFLREQIAGDLLPEADQDSRIASAFNRMHPMTAEGGVIDEEMRLTYVFDRVNTVATGVLGLTMDCSRCHDHKFDPLSQEEYYGFSAFFNNFRELGMTADDGNFGPYMLLTDAATQNTLDQYAASVRQQLSQLDQLVTAADLQSLTSNQVNAPRPDYFIDGSTLGSGTTTEWIDGSPYNLRAINGGPGRATEETDLVVDEERGGKVLRFNHPYDNVFLPQGVAQYRSTDPFSAALWFNTSKRDENLTQNLLGTTGSKADVWRGYEVYLDNENRLNVRIINELPDDLIHVRLTDSVAVREWHEVAFSYDGTGLARGLRLYLDGEYVEQEVLHDNLRGQIYPRTIEGWKNHAARPVRIGRSYRKFTGEDGVFVGKMDNIAVWNRALTAAEIARHHAPASELPSELIAEHTRRNGQAYQDAIAGLRRERAAQIAVQDTLPRLMVSEDMPTVRPTYLLDRGAYDAPKQSVEPQTPARILPFPEDLPANRLGLTEWLFLDDNPLTARVAINRYWQMLFGRGLVETAHDFGSQGALPSHPQLLDHLASDFRDGGWDLRRMLRTMVLSEAYRRDSRATDKQREWDSANIYLARGPSGRLPAEMIRDNALAAAGIIDRRIGGTSVKPYQPEGLWFQANQFSQALLHYQADAGDDLYRRSMYTFIKRTSPPPFMTNFDATGRDVCTVKRSKTNTPLQALNLLNDPQFVEFARVLAQRVQTEKVDVNEQLALAFRLVTGRRAAAREQAILQQLYAEELARFGEEPQLAQDLLATGEYPLPEHLDPIRTAAITSVGNVLFSHDEAYVKR